MRTIQLLSTAFLIILVVTSCSKKIDTPAVSFEVDTPTKSVSVGEPVVFDFKGNPDMITVYTGDQGHNYDFRERALADGKPVMNFTSTIQWGVQKNTLHLMISKDFNGKYTPDGIASATWEEFTNDATLSAGVPDTPSGDIDLSKYVSPGEIFYFAFQFTGTAGTTQRTWTIKNFKIDLDMDDGNVSNIVGMVSSGFVPVKILGLNSWVIAATQFSVIGGNATALENNNWLISAPLNPNKVSPDRGVAVKGIITDDDQFTYTYSRPGNYKVVFVATNARRDGEKSVLREVNIQVN